MTGNTGLLTARCDPYGAESGGPKHLLGGMHPASSMGHIMWGCENRADGRWIMVCQCPQEHKSAEPRPLCLAHVAEISRRQAGLCPPCAWNGTARAIEEQVGWVQGEISELFYAGGLYSPKMAVLQSELRDLAGQMTELFHLGIIYKCPLKLVEVS